VLYHYCWEETVELQSLLSLWLRSKELMRFTICYYYLTEASRLQLVMVESVVADEEDLTLPLTVQRRWEILAAAGKWSSIIVAANSVTEPRNVDEMRDAGCYWKEDLPLLLLPMTWPKLTALICNGQRRRCWREVKWMAWGQTIFVWALSN